MDCRNRTGPIMGSGPDKCTHLSIALKISSVSMHCMTMPLLMMACMGTNVKLSLTIWLSLNQLGQS